MNALELFCVTYIIIFNLQVSDCVRIPELEENLFRETHNNLQIATNKIFTLLKLNSVFTKSHKMQIYLTTHNNFKNIAEYYYKMYGEIEKMCKREIEHETSSLFRLDNLLEVILQENHTISYDNGTIENDLVMETNGTDSIEIPLNNTPMETKKTRRFLSSKSSSRSYNLLNLRVWQPSTPAEITNQKLTRRIYNGKATKISLYPFMVSVHVKNEFTCAGSLISKDLVITAASCMQTLYMDNIYKERPRSVSLRVGSDSIRYFGELIPASKIIVHPSYDPTTLKNNLAIVRMVKHLLFLKKNRKVRRIVYDRTPSPLPADIGGVTLLGWGASDSKNLLDLSSEPLKYAILNVYKMDECRNIYTRHYVFDSNFCAGTVAKGSGACNKDAGAPCVVDGILMGVVSYGPPACGTEDAPTVFTKVGYYANWIDNIIKESPPSVIGMNNSTHNKKDILVKTTSAFTHAMLPFSNQLSIRTDQIVTGKDKGERILTNILTELALSPDNENVENMIREAFSEHFNVTTMPTEILHEKDFEPLRNKIIKTVGSERDVQDEQEQQDNSEETESTDTKIKVDNNNKEYSDNYEIYLANSDKSNKNVGKKSLKQKKIVPKDKKRIKNLSGNGKETYVTNGEGILLVENENENEMIDDPEARFRKTVFNDGENEDLGKQQLKEETQRDEDDITEAHSSSDSGMLSEFIENINLD